MNSFKQTCDQPYDRHTYALVLINGKRIDFEDYEECSYVWMHTRSPELLSHIEVIDKKPKSVKGFGS